MNLGGLNEEETFFLEMPLAFLLSKRGRPHFGRLAANFDFKVDFQALCPQVY